MHKFKGLGLAPSTFRFSNMLRWTSLKIDGKFGAMIDRVQWKQPLLSWQNIGRFSSPLAYFKAKIMYI